MAEKPRKEKDYINLGRTLAENHFKTEAKKSEVSPDSGKPVDVALFKAHQFFGNNLLSWMYHYIRSRFGRKHKFLTYDETDNGIYKFSNERASFGLAADWASDTPDSDVIGRRIESHNPDFTVHLGDTYFVGAPSEIEANFLQPHSSWFRGTKGSFALMGNHEMYSRGIGYFRNLLPKMGMRPCEGDLCQGQKASFFCLENDYWRVIGLDTGYNSIGAIPILEKVLWMEKIPWLGKILIPKCSLHEELMKWLEETVKLKDDKRGLIFLSHHQYCSAFERDFVVIGEQLGKAAGENRPVLWLWGHEHRMSVYAKFGKAPCVQAYGRCIGNGGMPIELVKTMPLKQIFDTKPLVLFDNRYKETIEDVEIGHNGYAILTIEGSTACIDYYDSSKKLLSEKWEADISSGEIKGTNIEVFENELALMTDVKSAIA